jgi:hypothetical protein
MVISGYNLERVQSIISGKKNRKREGGKKRWGITDVMLCPVMFLAFAE